LSPKKYYDKYTKKEKEGLCYCGERTYFKDSTVGYNKYCSTKCAANSKELKRKKVKTCLKKYGKSNVLLCKRIQNKCRLTKYKKYGSRSFNNRIKAERTTKERYGVSNISQNKKIKIKKKETSLKNYGVPFSAMIPSITKKRIIKMRRTRIKRGTYHSLKQLTLFQRYVRLVMRETKKHKKCLFKQWNGLDYYTHKKLLNNKIFRKIHPKITLSRNKIQPTIDHKVSMFYGFKHNISAKKIGSLSNLCICGKDTNSKKQRRSYGKDYVLY
jgi:hypothetical protein